MRRAVLLAVGLAWIPGRVIAQDTAAVAPVPDSVPAATAAAPADTLYPRAPISPMGALWRSLLIPGWGQAKLNRKLTGALFVAWEGVTLGMSIKTNHEFSYLKATGSASASAKQKERQDWLVLLGFNHLFAAVEAYVSSHLWDFPPDLTIQAGPIPGGIGAVVRLPVRLP
jgi:hypothetical protein